MERIDAKSAVVPRQPFTVVKLHRIEQNRIYFPYIASMFMIDWLIIFPIFATTATDANTVLSLERISTFSMEATICTFAALLNGS